MDRQGNQPRWRKALHDFIHLESAGGFVLMAVSAFALAWANSPWSELYSGLWHLEIPVQLGDFDATKSLHHWVNDGFMALFFFVAGLEIKRELTTGRLRERKTAALPIMGAIGGMVVPAGLFFLFTHGTPAARGWAMPMATDIAFALGLLSMFGDRVPSSMKAFLLTLAIVDDLGAIIVIALFYTQEIHMIWWLGAAAAIIATLGLQRLDIRRPAVYIMPGLLLWFSLWKSGVHPTLAGVTMGLMTPVLGEGKNALIPGLIDRLHPWTSFAVMPLFALANAGIPISLKTLTSTVSEPLGLGVLSGLVMGKPLGICLTVQAAVWLGWGKLADGLTRTLLVGLATLGGVGFTVSLFIAELAFKDADLLALGKLSVLLASAGSALLALAIIKLGLRSVPSQPDPISA